MARQIKGEPVASRRTPGRPSVEDSEGLRSAIIGSAIDEFVEKGFEFGTMNHIAEASGVTKATVYRLYASKENLFKVAIRWALQQSRLSRWSIDGALDPEAVLIEAAEKISHSYETGAVSALWHSLLAVRRRFPDFYEEVQTILREESNAASLAIYLAELHRRGSLDIPDPLMTAHHFSLLVGQGRELALPAHSSREAEKARVAQIVAIFLIGLRRTSPQTVSHHQ